VLAQSGINAVQPGAALELRVEPGHKGPHVTERRSDTHSIIIDRAPEKLSESGRLVIGKVERDSGIQ
jgi:hypothetical protein